MSVLSYLLLRVELMVKVPNGYIKSYPWVISNPIYVE